MRACWRDFGDGCVATGMAPPGDKPISARSEKRGVNVGRDRARRLRSRRDGPSTDLELGDDGVFKRLISQSSNKLL